MAWAWPKPNSPMRWAASAALHSPSWSARVEPEEALDAVHKGGPARVAGQQLLQPVPNDQREESGSHGLRISRGRQFTRGDGVAGHTDEVVPEPPEKTVGDRGRPLVPYGLRPYLYGDPQRAIGTDVGIHHVERRAHHVEQRAGRVGGEGLEHTADLLRVALRDRLDDLVLTLEIAVHGSDREPRLVDHVLHGAGMEAVAKEAGTGRVENLQAASGEVRFGDTRHVSNLKRAIVLDKRTLLGASCEKRRMIVRFMEVCDG